MTTVRKATEADVVRIGRTALIAFADDPMVRWFYPDQADYDARMPAAWRTMARRCIAHGSAYTTDDSVSIALFVPPGRPKVDVPPDPEAVAPSEALLKKFEAVGAVMSEHAPAEPHWYLNVLGTHPHWQRQGLGAAVIAPIGEVCRQEGLPMYLETLTPQNVAYYTHLGFRIRDEWDVPLDGPHMWGMIRET